MGEDFSTENTNARPSGLRLVGDHAAANPVRESQHLDPATAEAHQRLVRPQTKVRGRHEPYTILALVTIALAALTIGYVGGRGNQLLATAAADSTSVGQSSTAPTTPPTTLMSTTIPPTTSVAATAPPTTAPPTTVSPSIDPVVAPPSLTDDFDDAFRGETEISSPATVAPTTTSPTTVLPFPSSDESASVLLKPSPEVLAAITEIVAEATERTDPDDPVLASGLALDLPENAPGAEFLALATDIFGADGPQIVALDQRADAYAIEGSIRFEYKSSVIIGAYLPFLDQMAELMDRTPGLTLVVVGHTDSRGDAKKNLQLSKDRAESVVAYLSYVGVDPDRLTAIGQGEIEPIGDNNTEAGRELNRRIQLVLDRLVS